jgi:hypothetical protein
MTIEQIEKGKSILKMLNIWKARYAQYQNRSLSRVSMYRKGCEEVHFDGTGNDLSIRFFHEVELKYGELCEKQIESLTKELEEL